MYFPVFIGLAGFAIYIVLLFSSFGARDEITNVDPEYAFHLFNGTTGQIFFHSLPMRGVVLFFAPIPTKLHSTIYLIRYIYAAFYTYIFLFFVWVMYELMR